MSKTRKARLKKLRQLAESVLQSTHLVRPTPAPSLARRLRVPALVVAGTGLVALLVVGTGYYVMSVVVDSVEEDAVVDEPQAGESLASTAVSTSPDADGRTS